MTKPFRGAIALLSAGLLGGGVLSACAANPGPPPVVEEAPSEPSTTSTTTNPPPEPTERSRVAVGVDPLQAGLNPHLLADNQQLVEDIADLVLPSVFHGDQLDTDVVDSAEEVEAPEGVAQRLRYEISSAAQWSDGTPLTSADFSYLWEKMRSAPGVKSPAAYQAISAVHSSDGGKIVTVDLSTRVADWRVLFQHLLPAHLLEEGDASFSAALANDIPASAGRFLVASVDNARGIITLNRNDRYWGAEPAQLDVIELHYMRSSQQAVNMLRTGQVGFADILPEQTTMESLSLVPGVEAQTQAGLRQLRLQLSTRTLADASVRRALASLVDTDQLARLATSRSADLAVARNPVSAGADLTPLRELAENRPIRLAADPSDVPATNAAHALVDVLTSQGIAAEVVGEKMSVITSTLLPNERADAVLAWHDLTLQPADFADYFVCPSPENKAGGDLSGYCPEDAEAQLGRILGGEYTGEQALEQVRALNAAQTLYVPIIDETRVHAVGRGIAGPAGAPAEWSLETAPTWKEGERVED